jgi:hypothetical protein
MFVDDMKNHFKTTTKIDDFRRNEYSKELTLLNIDDLVVDKDKEHSDNN